MNYTVFERIHEVIASATLGRFDGDDVRLRRADLKQGRALDEMEGKLQSASGEYKSSAETFKLMNCCLASPKFAEFVAGKKGIDTAVFTQNLAVMHPQLTKDIHAKREAYLPKLVQYNVSYAARINLGKSADQMEYVG